MACKSSQTVLATNHHTSIMYGSLGGFAGSYEEYKILPNGDVFYRQRYNGDFNKIQPVQITMTNQFFELMEQFCDQEIEMNDAGNLTYFMKYTKNNKQQLELIWGGENDETSPQVVQLYKLLRQTTKNKYPVR